MPKPPLNGPMAIGLGYVFETDTLNYGGEDKPNWYLRISAAGSFSREDVQFVRDALDAWLAKHQ